MDFIYNGRDNRWYMFLGDTILMSVDDMYVQEYREFTGNRVSGLEAFKMLCGEAVLNALIKESDRFSVKCVVKLLFNIPLDKF